MTSLSPVARAAGMLDSSLVDRLGLKPFLYPTMDSPFEISHTETGYAVSTDVPGFAASEVDITCKDAVLSIVATNERRSVKRSIILGDEIDTDNIEAKLENGTLTLSLRRFPEAEVKRIEIKAS